MPDLNWYLKRLSVMTPREIVGRAGQQATVLSLLVRHHFGGLSAFGTPKPSRFRFCNTSVPQLPDLAFQYDELRRTSGALLNGELPVGNRFWRWHAGSDVWHRAPDTGRLWPRSFFAAIPYREGNPFGDVRLLWEPARLQQLLDLALVAELEGPGPTRRKAMALITAQLDSWVRQNPALTGPHYLSAMECGLRLIVVCHALDRIRSLGPEASAWGNLLYIVASHAPLIRRFLSRHSSSGNHTIAEAAALIYAGSLFPEMRGASQWLRIGTTVLEREANRQVLQDGGGIEQAFHYHRFNVQLLALAEQLWAYRQEPVPSPVHEAVSRGADFLHAMGQERERLVPVGDSDGGWALSRHLMLPGGRPTHGRPRVTTFPESGYTALRIPAGAGIEASALLDHGELGMPPAFGHGHADALSLLLRLADDDVFLDTGTGTYTGDRQWRRYFRGTRAHNTVTVDGLDQARQEGCFLWSEPYHGRLVASEARDTETGRLLAAHDGYRRMGITHLRGLAWKAGDWLLIWDCIQGEGRHLLELHWHLAGTPQWTDRGTFLLKAGGHGIGIELRGGRPLALRGQRQPLLGWRSPGYGVMEEITTIKVSYRGWLPHELTTLVRLPPGRVARTSGIEDELIWMRRHALWQTSGWRSWGYRWTP